MPRKKRRTADALNWGPWKEGTLDPEIMAAKTSAGARQVRVFLNRAYQVIIYEEVKVPIPEKTGWPEMVWLSIKRIDKKAIHDWRHLQWIKNDLVGEECEGLELYPAESRLVDQANQYHLWVMKRPERRFPLGYDDRDVATRDWTNPEDGSTSRQRPFPRDRQPKEASDGGADDPE